MKLKSSLILIVAAFFILSCATIGPKSASQSNDSQTGVELALASGIQYYLEDIYDYDILFMIQPMIKQTLVSEIQYYLEDIYDYDYDSVSFMAENETPFFFAEPVPKQTADSKNIADYFAILSIFDENPFSTTEPVPSPTLASGTRYYLEDIYDYDDEQYSGRN